MDSRFLARALFPIKTRAGAQPHQSNSQFLNEARRREILPLHSEATPAHERWFDELQRVSTSAENAARPMETDDNIDVRGLLRQVQMPTLVVHCDRDHVVSPKYGCQMAAEISNARYVSLPSANHLLLAEEPAWRIFLKSLSIS